MVMHKTINIYNSFLNMSGIMIINYDDRAIITIQIFHNNQTAFSQWRHYSEIQPLLGIQQVLVMESMIYL